MDGGYLTGDRYILHQATMTQLIAAAYNLDEAYVQGGPSWLDWDRYDIEALKLRPQRPKKPYGLCFSRCLRRGSAL